MSHLQNSILAVTLLAGVALAPALGADGPPLALTPAEYNNTVADLLGFPRDGTQWPERSALADTLSPRRKASKGVFAPSPPPAVWPWRFPVEPGANGFQGIDQGQDPSSYQVEELHLAAMHFASFVLSSPSFFSCEGWESMAPSEQASCAEASLARFARRAWRRPLSETELARIAAFWQRNQLESDLDQAVAMTAAGILQAPAFHFRLPAGAKPSVWDLASRLSYFLWDSMPDKALLTAAETGELATRAGIEAQARRMLDDPKARDAVIKFHHRWLETDKTLLVAPARRAFGSRFGIAPQIKTASDDDLEWPAIMGAVRHSMKLETELFVEHTVFEGAGTLEALLTHNRGYMSEATAPIYGDGARRIEGGQTVTRPVDIIVASMAKEVELTLYPAEFPAHQRAGVLTLPSVLAIGAYAVQPGPILRGVRVLERLACMELGAPVEGAEAALPPDTLTAESTNRERTATATSPPVCRSCHRKINPPGFAFEHYDAIGSWRAEDNGQPVDASGTLTLAGGETLTFTDGIDLAHQLARSERVHDCYALHWTRVALGRQLSHSAPELGPIQAAFRADDSIRGLLVTIATSDVFRQGPASVGAPVR